MIAECEMSKYPGVVVLPVVRSIPIFFFVVSDNDSGGKIPKKIQSSSESEKVGKSFI